MFQQTRGTIKEAVCISKYGAKVMFFTVNYRYIVPDRIYIYAPNFKIYLKKEAINDGLC